MDYRLRYDFTRSAAADTGRLGDTGYLWGKLEQIAWQPTAGDTGDTGLIEVTLLPKESDSGDGILIYTESRAFGSGNFTRYVRQPEHASDGTDTGVDSYTKVIGMGGRLRVKMRLGDTGATGRLYVWVS